MKRMLAILLTMVMLAVSVPASIVMADGFAPDISDETVNVTDMGWAATAWRGAAPSWKISPSVTYQGSGALHIAFETDGDNTTNDDFVIRANQASYLLDANTSYKLSFYAKILTNDVKHGVEGTEALAVRFGADEKISVNLQADTDGDGWQYWEKELSYEDARANNYIGFPCGNGNIDAYIDCVQLIPTAVKEGETSTHTIGQNVLTTQMTHFDDGKPKFEPDTSDETVEVTSMGWGTYAWNGAAPSLKISPSVTYQGSGALHIAFKTDGLSNVNDNFVVRANAAAYLLQPNTTYKLSFYVKVNTNDFKDSAPANEALMVRFGEGSDTNLSANLAADTDGDGWQLYEKTITTGATVTNNQLGFWGASGNIDVYLDCIQLVPTATTNESLTHTIGQNVLTTSMAYFDDGKPNFEPDTSDETVDVTTLGWATYVWNGATPSLKISPSVTYQGSGALHIAFETDGDKNINDNFVVRANAAAYLLQANTTYKLSFYAKVNTNDLKDGTGTKEGLLVRFGNGEDTNLSENLAADDDGDGWQLYEKTITTGTTVTNNQLGFWGSAANIDVYIDNVKLEVVSGSLSTNILTKKMTYFDEDTPEEEVVVPSVTDRPENVPDLTADSNISTYDWEAHAYKNGSAFAGSTAYSAEVTSEVAYEGKSSLHIKFTKDSTTDSILVRPIQTHNLVSGSTYTVTMYFKVIQNSANGLAIKSVNTVSKKPGVAAEITVDKDGWYKYTETGTIGEAATRVTIGCDAGTCELYVDNVSIVTGETDLFADKKGSFETATDKSYTVSEAKLFDAEGTEIEDVTAAESGKTITAAAAVTNYTEADTFSGQIIVCVYNNNILEKVNYSEGKVIKSTDCSKTLTTEVELPTITAETEDNYTVKVFVWEAVDTLVPLEISTSF